MNENLLYNYIDDNISQLFKIREKIHKNPELSNEERETTNSIEQFLNENDIIFNRFKDINGGYVFIDCNKNESVAYRADIDALPIEENTNCDFSSNNRGIMHACGHDIHTTIALGLCLTLEKFKTNLNTNFVIIFQPAEENNPRGGAKDVINEGIFEKYSIKEIYGAHCWPKYKIGDVLVKSGVQQAASNKFTVEIEGVSSHAAEPHLGTDAINIAIQFVDYAINKLRREINPNEVCIVSIGKLISNSRYNVISNKVTLEGTIRSASFETQQFIFRRLKNYIEFINSFYETNSVIFISDGYESVSNNKDLVNKFNKSQQKYNDLNIISDFETSLIAEDFYAYGKVAKSMFVFLGCGTNEPLHSDKFLPDSNLIGFGVNLFARYFIL
ncbi:M20 metallopeptidase family protein [Tepidanaerobacter acetatoxydans]|uniref:M20 metallopeptidase family protein n=1 Tax=Tepidanaerobacter acetatoxydans TaxID=499229 RepID=UPI001BD24132|nr:M20 family metallopeptidase [Tepidanaerobacter acetatoxydans]